jgi:hypothetical protein
MHSVKDKMDVECAATGGTGIRHSLTWDQSPAITVETGD